MKITLWLLYQLIINKMLVNNVTLLQEFVITWTSIHILSKWQFGFRKGFSTQYCLFVMAEKWQKCLNNGGVSWAILTVLSKAFDCILHDLLIIKLASYGFNHHSLRIIKIFLSKRQQRTKSNNAFSRYPEIIYGVPQGFILWYHKFCGRSCTI